MEKISDEIEFVFLSDCPVFAESKDGDTKIETANFVRKMWWHQHGDINRS